MDTEERRREQERLIQFRQKFEDFMATRSEQDAKQPVGRHYEPEINAQHGDLRGQWEEQQQTIDYDFEWDQKNLINQDLTERKAFEDWAREQRQSFREEDRLEIVQQDRKFMPRHDYSREAFKEAQSAAFEERETLRAAAESKMRDTLTEYQDRTNHDRFEILNARNDANVQELDRLYEREQLKQSFVQLVRDNSGPEHEP